MESGNAKESESEGSVYRVDTHTQDWSGYPDLISVSTIIVSFDQKQRIRVFF